MKRAFGSSLLRSSLIIPIGMLLNFAMTWVLAARLSTEGFGEFSFIVFSANFLAIAASLGLPMACQKIIPELKTDKKSRLTLEHYISLCLLFLMLLFTGILILSLFIWVSSESFRLLAIVMVSFSQIVWLFQRYISLGEDRVALAIIPRDVIVPTLVMLFVGGYFVNDYVGSIIVYVTSIVIASGIGLFWCIAKMNMVASMTSILRLENVDYKSLLFQSSPFAVTSIGMLGLSGLEVVVASRYITMSEIGIYSFVLKVALLSSLINRIIATTFGQWFSTYYTQGDMQSFIKLYRKSTYVSVTISVFAFVVLCVFGGEVLSAVNPGYVAGYSAMIILTLGQMVGTCVGPVTMCLNMSGNQGVNAKVTLGFAIVNLSICALVAETYGIIGVALTAAISVACCKLVSFFFLNRLLFEQS